MGSESLLKNKLVIGGIVGGIIIILLLSFLIMNKKNTFQSTNPSNSQQSTFPSKIPGNSTSLSPTPKLYPIPVAYKSEPIPTSIYTEAQHKYSEATPEKINKDVLFYIIRFYSYKDALLENKIAYTPPNPPYTLDILENQLPIMNQLVKDNLISKSSGSQLAIRKYATIDQLLQEKMSLFRY